MTDNLKDAFLSKEVLVDIETIKIDTTLSKEERIQSYIQQIKNPYWCKCKDIIIESVFSDTEVTISQRMKQYIELMSETGYEAFTYNQAQ